MDDQQHRHADSASDILTVQGGTTIVGDLTVLPSTDPAAELRDCFRAVAAAYGAHAEAQAEPYRVEAEIVVRDAAGSEARHPFEYTARNATTPQGAVDELSHSFTSDTDRRITKVNDGE